MTTPILIIILGIFFAILFPYAEKANRDHVGLTIFVGIILFAGYVTWSPSPKQLLVGTWKNNQETIQIYKGNVFTTSKGLAGSFVLTEKNKAIVTAVGMSIPVSYTVSVENLTINDGKQTKTYQRQSEPSLAGKFAQNTIEVITSFLYY